MVKVRRNQKTIQGHVSPGGVSPAPDQDKCLDTIQLHQLEQSFREWINASPRKDVRASRLRILMIFLLIRYTGAKLNEVLTLDPFQDIDFIGQTVNFSRMQEPSNRIHRTVQLPENVSREIKAMLSDEIFSTTLKKKLDMDPGFVRRKFYERAQACKIAKQLGAPEVLRKSRAVELMQNNMPLPAVQTMLGHSTPNLTSAYVSFSEEDIQQTIRLFVDKESGRRTSARNSFFGKIQTLLMGDVMTRVELLTMGGHILITVITNDSVQRLGLKKGKLITAEVKAPWVMLQKCSSALECSADNMFKGTIRKIISGAINSEYIVEISDGTRICSIVTTESCKRLALKVGDEVWTFFNSSSVVLFS